MGREIRRVKENWEHPVKNDSYVPLMKNYLGAVKDFKLRINEYIVNVEVILQGGEVEFFSTTCATLSELVDYYDYELLIPSPGDYMPSGEWYQVFENVSEGTPITPPFKTKEELGEWMIENDDYYGNRWAVKAIENLIEGGYVPSGIMIGGVIKRSHEIY